MDLNKIPIDQVFVVLKGIYTEMLRLLEVGDVNNVKQLLRVMIFTIELGEKTKAFLDKVKI